MNDIGLKKPLINKNTKKAIHAGIKNSFIFIGNYSLIFGYIFEINNFVELKKETSYNPEEILKMKLRDAYKKLFGIKVKGKTGNIDNAINKLIQNTKFLDFFFNMDVKECLDIFISENPKINIEGKEESIYEYKNSDYEYKNSDYEYHKFNENNVKEFKKQIDDLYNYLFNNKIKSKKEKSDKSPCQEKREENSESEKNLNNVQNILNNRERKKKMKILMKI